MKEINVLIVDDEQSIRFLLKEFFHVYCQNREIIPPQVFMAENAEAGVEIIKKHPITLLVSDVQMPGELGDSFVRSVSEQSPETLSILMSGWSKYDPPEDLPIVCFLKKPFNYEVFEEALDKAFEKIISE